MKLKKLCIILAILMLALSFAGCAAKSSSYAAPMAEEPAADYSDSYYEPMDEGAMADGDYNAEADMAEKGTGLDLDINTVVETDRKIIYTSNYSIDTYNFSDDYKGILSAMTAAGGYLSSENTRGTEPEAYGDSGRVAELTLRVPVKNYSQFLETLSGIGTVTNKSQSTEDVTTEYHDNDSRIEFYEAHYEKLMKYLEQATEMEDILSIESQITETMYTLDALKGNKSYYDSLTTYSTVNITLYERVKSTDIPATKESFGDRIGEGLSGVLKGMGNFFTGLAEFLIVASPVLAVLAILFCAIFFPVRAGHKKKKARLAAKQAALQNPENTPEK